MGDPNTLGLGLIGCGAFGFYCLDTYRKMPELRPAAVADVRPDVARDFGRDFDVPAFTDPEEMMALADVDIVHIATPPSSHHELALTAIARGKHVLCEKPLAMNLAQADAMLNAAQEADRICPVNFVLRYNEVTYAVKRVIDSGVMGQMLSGRLTNCASDSNLGPGHWFWDKAVSGGIFVEHGVHFFDLYRYWLGDGQVLSAHTETRENTTQEDRVTALVRHDGGALVSHYHAFDQVGPMDRTNHRMVFELGDIWVDGWIPLQMTVDAVVDEAGLEHLKDCLPHADIHVIQDLELDEDQVPGRGVNRHLTRRVRMYFCPNADKNAVYSQSVRDLMADQVAYIRDHAHTRTVAEENGRIAVGLAETAAKMAEG